MYNPRYFNMAPAENDFSTWLLKNTNSITGKILVITMAAYIPP